MNQESAEHFDAIVIGAGQSGGPLSTALAGAGYKTALIERAAVGGTCINWGCTPTKTMVASARVAYLARRAAEYGVHTGPVTIDLQRVRERKRAIVESFRAGSQGQIESAAGLQLIFGEARFSSPKALEVRSGSGAIRRLIADRFVVIDTGDSPLVPDIPGLGDVPWLDSTSIMELGGVPEHLIVLGGGYVALEFGQMFRRFGSAVTIVEREAQLLVREDADVAEAVAGVLRDEGIEVFLQTEARRAERDGDGVRLTLSSAGDGSQRSLSGSHLLVAVGRVPNTSGLNLAATGVETDQRGYITTNERLETTVPGIYALGDVKGGPAFTHISYDDWRVMRANLLEGGNASIRDRVVPYTVFIDPQLGRVGMTEKEARAAGLPIRVARLPMTDVARALETDETRGFLKAVVHAETKQILGFAALATEGGELMNMVEIAMLGKLPYTTLKEAIFAHPTFGESLNSLFMALDA